MERIRTIKPNLSLHKGLYDPKRETWLPIRTSLVGLFVESDCEGRFVEHGSLRHGKVTCDLVLVTCDRHEIVRNRHLHSRPKGFLQGGQEGFNAYPVTAVGV